VSTNIVELLKTNSADSIEVRSVEFVGPQFGQELFEKGVLALLYALIGVMIYVAFRFEWKFSLGSVAALIHDILITVGLFSIINLEFTLPVLAALLAVIGYSLNDTIVVFDRIRENFRRLRETDTEETMNASINQTLPRTILTSFTTLLVLVALYVYGGEALGGFAATLIIGVLIGTYSSIFIASPTVLGLGAKAEDLIVEEVEKEGAEHPDMQLP
jgi:preprotein translocase subunit SecF